MNKNAFEIRLELLNLAHSDAQNRFYEKLNLLKEADCRDYDAYVTATADGRSAPGQPFISKCTSETIDKLFPTSTDIITRAKELYQFIEGK